MWKPFLIPNDKGIEVDWKERLKIPKNWLVLTKRDGVRVEITKDTIKGRSLKLIVNKQINQMSHDLQLRMLEGFVIEAEFYSHEMTFPEIMHFFKTEDITSEHTKKKYEKLWVKTKGEPSLGWKFPGRSVQWLTTWHQSLHFRLFDAVNLENCTKPARLRLAYAMVLGAAKNCKFGPLKEFKTTEEIVEYYHDRLDNGYEGLVLMHKEGQYKQGRATLNEGSIFKMKEDKLEFDGEIIGLVQATVVNPNAPTTTNELGRTVTSKKQGDRVPIEAISGFKVRLDDGREQTVSLRGWDDSIKVKAWEAGISWYKNKWIVFTGMRPVKEGGAVRHPQFKYFRDEK